MLLYKWINWIFGENQLHSKAKSLEKKKMWNKNKKVSSKIERAFIIHNIDPMETDDVFNAFEPLHAASDWEHGQPWNHINS